MKVQVTLPASIAATSSGYGTPTASICSKNAISAGPCIDRSGPSSCPGCASAPPSASPVAAPPVSAPPVSASVSLGSAAAGSSVSVVVSAGAAVVVVVDDAAPVVGAGSAASSEPHAARVTAVAAAR